MAGDKLIEPFVAGFEKLDEMAAYEEIDRSSRADLNRVLKEMAETIERPK